MAKNADALAFLETYAALKRSLEALSGEMYGSAGLSGPQAKLLRHIAANPGISQAELARAACADAAFTGRALQPLLDEGWVERHRSSQDRREYVLSLCPRGRPVLKRAEEVRGRLAAHLVSLLDAEDLAAFQQLAEKLTGEPQPPAPVSPDKPARVKRSSRRG